MKTWLNWPRFWLMVSLLWEGQGVSLAQPPAGQVAVPVRVVAVAGGRAYLSAGRSKGIARGARVRFKKAAFKVVAVSANNAMIERRDSRPRLGATGRVLVAADGSVPVNVERLPAPSPLSSFKGRWPKAELPASTQHPEPVPLGAVRKGSPSSVYLALASAGILPLSGDSGAIGRGQLRARITAVPVSSVPFSLTGDMIVAGWFGPGLDGRPGNTSRPLLFVRELAARYGHYDGFQAALGRMPYVATALGMLDGARVQAPLTSEFRLAAFGGAVPNPLSGTPLFDASRFGAEMIYEDVASELRPRATLTAHGSYFDGALDERQLQATADFFPSFGRFGGHVAMRLFDEDNPWNAPTTQLYAAGGHAHFLLGSAELGGRVDVYRPERSRFLASFLPSSWFCTPRPGEIDTEGDACYGDELYLTGQIDARYTGEHAMFALGATADGTQHLFSQQLGGFAHLRLQRLLSVLRFDAFATYRHGSLLRGGRLRTGFGYTSPGGSVDMSVYYQPAYLTYRADVEFYLEHGAGADLWFKAGGDVDVVLAADMLTGRDVDMVTFQAQLHYRPDL